MVVIFGCCADKDVDGMLQQLQLGADKVTFTISGTPRSVDPHELHNAVPSCSLLKSGGQ